MRLIGAPLTNCHGYANCCTCDLCSARSKGIASGRLFYGQAGELRFADNPGVAASAALRAYMLEVEREARAARVQLHAA